MLLALAAQVTLVAPRPVRPGVAAFPRIARPDDAAARRVNAALTRLDEAVRRAVRECRADSDAPTSWTRTVEATMRGPAFVSYLVGDEVNCGGAHPTDGHAAIVYDLSTGLPVNWARLLGSRLAGEQALATGADGVRTVTLSLPRLRALYAARYDAAVRAAEAPADCIGAVDADGFVRPMIAWLEAGRGLGLRFDLNHAMQACSVAVTIPVAVLQREGASARLTEALRGVRR